MFEKKATALGFDPSKDRAPKIIAQGSGLLASSIIEVAVANGIAVVRDPDLCEMTQALPLNTEIPENLYTAIAALLGMVMQLRAKEKSAL